MRGELSGSTVELVRLGGGEGQESSGLYRRLAALARVRMLSWSKALKSRLDACFGVRIGRLLIEPDGALGSALLSRFGDGRQPLATPTWWLACQDDRR